MTHKPHQRAKFALLPALALGLFALVTACNGGLRPTLIEEPTPTPQPPLDLDLPAAPPAAIQLNPADPSLPLESSVDDALHAWASSGNVAYLDACSLATPGPGQLCDIPTERDTVRLLGPSPTEIWYVVTVAEIDSFDFGTGYRVASVDIAGA